MKYNNKIKHKNNEKSINRCEILSENYEEDSETIDYFK